MEEAYSFQDGFTAALMATEELRQHVTNASSKEGLQKLCLQEIRHGMEDVMARLFSLQPSDNVEEDMRKHCHEKVGALARFCLDHLIKTKEEGDPDETDPEFEKDCQGLVARIAELNLALQENDQEKVEEIIDTYTSYQRKVLRLRSKPAIARLVAYRQQLQSKTLLQEEDDEELQRSQHSHVITTILGQASSLIHPLIQWKRNLPPELQNLDQMCTKSIHILDEQAQSLTQTVATWCFEDRNIEEWMSKSATNDASPTDDTADLDALLDDMAFSCQVFDRYVELVEDYSQIKTIKDDLHPEWTWKYAALERYLTTQQLSSALHLAKPVNIVMGTSIQVPSVVEDAQYLSTRALERAASTRSTQAIGTVAHSIANDVWSTDIDQGVHQALVEQQGCWEEPKTSETNNTDSTKPNSNSFAQALLGALDEDLAISDGNANKNFSTPPRNKTPRSAASPSSGNFLSSLSALGSGDKIFKIRLISYLCALNGIHSASAACTSLVSFFDSLLPTEEIQQEDKASTMIHLAREELFRFSGNYQKLLKQEVCKVVKEFCGSSQDVALYKGSLCIPVLKYYLERENYELPNADELKNAEDDARLRKQFIEPLEESYLLQHFQKCDADVLRAICEELATALVDLFLECIHSKVIPKRFTDWGSLLLSKQVRTVQNQISSLMEKASDHTIPILPQWERLSQAVTILQLEKPSDWSFYEATSILSLEQVEQILLLRIDFSRDAVAAVLAGSK